jgi:hypothetical protein
VVVHEPRRRVRVPRPYGVHHARVLVDRLRAPLGEPYTARVERHPEPLDEREDEPCAGRAVDPEVPLRVRLRQRVVVTGLDRGGELPVQPLEVEDVVRREARHGEPRREAFGRGAQEAELGCVLGRDGVDRDAAVRLVHDEPLSLEQADRFPDRGGAHPEQLRELCQRHALARAKFAGDDGRTQPLDRKLGLRPMPSHVAHAGARNA